MKILLFILLSGFLLINCEQKPIKYPYGIPEEEYKTILYGVLNTSNAVANSSGTVRFPATGLEWKRCAQGQVFRSTEGDCKGTSRPTSFTPVDLTYGATIHAYCNTASNNCNSLDLVPLLNSTNTSTSTSITAYTSCSTDTTALSPTDINAGAWRVPTVVELKALASLGKLSTYKLIPDAPDEKYWSATGDVNDLTAETSKAISFEPGTYGNEYSIKKDTKLYIRCIRNYTNR